MPCLDILFILKENPNYLISKSFKGIWNFAQTLIILIKIVVCILFYLIKFFSILKLYHSIYKNIQKNKI